MAYDLIVVDASAALALVLAENEGREVAELIQDTISINGQIFVPRARNRENRILANACLQPGISRPYL